MELIGTQDTSRYFLILFIFYLNLLPEETAEEGEVPLCADVFFRERSTFAHETHVALFSARSTNSIPAATDDETNRTSGSIRDNETLLLCTSDALGHHCPGRPRHARLFYAGLQSNTGSIGTSGVTGDVIIFVEKGQSMFGAGAASGLEANLNDKTNCTAKMGVVYTFIRAKDAPVLKSKVDIISKVQPTLGPPYVTKIFRGGKCEF